VHSSHPEASIHQLQTFNTSILNVQYGSHPERLKNLHFAFVVVLRAVRKAAPYLYNYPFSVGDSHEDEVRIDAAYAYIQKHINAYIYTRE
jgi:ERO1-like protein alpha